MAWNLSWTFRIIICSFLKSTFASQCNCTLVHFRPPFPSRISLSSHVLIRNCYCFHFSSWITSEWKENHVDSHWLRCNCMPFWGGNQGYYSCPLLPHRSFSVYGDWSVLIDLTFCWTSLDLYRDDTWISKLSSLYFGEASISCVCFISSSWGSWISNI